MLAQLYVNVQTHTIKPLDISNHNEMYKFRHLTRKVAVAVNTTVGTDRSEMTATYMANYVLVT